MEIQKIIEKINTYSINNLDIRPYCKRKMEERNIDEEILTSTLFSNSLYYVEEQDKIFQGKIEKRHKLVFRISSKYSLIIIVAFYTKVLKIINTIKTSKSMEKKWRKEVLE